LHAADRGDFDAIPSFYARDAVWDSSRQGIGTFEGVAAVRSVNEDWFAAYEEWEVEPEEILDVGNGVVFVVFRQNARPVGSTAQVRLRQAAVLIWALCSIGTATARSPTWPGIVGWRLGPGRAPWSPQCGRRGKPKSSSTKAGPLQFAGTLRSRSVRPLRDALSENRGR
jgi:SnoaL-like domain